MTDTFIKQISKEERGQMIELLLPMDRSNKEEEEEESLQLLVDYSNTEYPPEDYIDPSSQEDNIYLQ